jgi:transcriptional regulator with XRE-family HTH domain
MNRQNECMNMNETRKANLRRIISKATPSGQVADFARKYSLDPSYISQLLNEHRNIGEKSARNIEAKLGLELLDLDKPIGDQDSLEAATALAMQAGPEVLKLLEHYMKAPPELRAGALRLLGVPESLRNEQSPQKPGK